MKFVLLSVGTLGDMEPFVAIGEILKEKGHQVVCAFPEQFRNLAEESGLEFVSLGAKFIEMLDSDDGKAVLGGGSAGIKKIMANIRLAQSSTEVNKELINTQHELIKAQNPDIILHSGKAIYPLIWGLTNKNKNILICPMPYMHYVKGHTHVAFNSNFGVFFNKLTFSLVNFGMILTIKMSIKWLKNYETSFSWKQIKNGYLNSRAIYAVSPSLFSRPDYWKDNLDVLGFHERNKISSWRPSKELTDFLEKHEKIIFVTFGSMTNPNPLEKTKIILEILERNKIPAIINIASGGLVEPDNFKSEQICFVSHIPYDWIFPKMYGVIHHGGSGTTHLSLKYGCATMIIPHIIDQFVWDTIICKLGAGPKGVKIGNITAKKLEPKILQFVTDHSYKMKAAQIASQMEKEDLKENIYQAIVEG